MTTLGTFRPQNSHTITIELTGEIIERTVAFAKRIELANRTNKRQNKQGLTSTPEESMAARISGYLGEAAVAIHLGLPGIVRIADEWTHRPDVGPFNVMTTKRLDGKLIVTPHDAGYIPKALVIDCCPTFYICGWAMPSDVRTEPQWFQEPRPGGGAWFVPQAMLLALHESEWKQKERAAREQTNAVDWRQMLRDQGIEPIRPDEYKQLTQGRWDEKEIDTEDRDV